MKQRIRTGLLGLVLAFPLFAPFVAYADSATLYLSPASSSVAKGSILTVNVRENSGAEPVNSVQANLTYPAELLDFVSISSSTAWGVVAENSGGGGSVKIARGALPAVTGDQLVASVRFKAKTDSGTASISFASGSAVVSANSSTDVKSGDRGGSYTLTAQAPAPVEAPKDTTPPTITAVKASEVTATTAVISWTTSEPATSEVSYGPSQGYGIATADTNAVTEHKVTLNSPLIIPGTTYHFMVRSIDPSGNAVSGADSTFLTVGATLEARVVNQSNKPISGAKVSFGDVSGKTDKNGKVTLTNLPLGKLTGVVSYKNKQAPAVVQLDTLLDKNGKPHSATFKIDVSSDLWLRIAILVLIIALVGSILYRRGGGGPGTPNGNNLKDKSTNPTPKLAARLKAMLGSLKGRLAKKKDKPAVSIDAPAADIASTPLSSPQPNQVLPSTNQPSAPNNSGSVNDRA